MAFNASAIEFADPGFVDRLHGLIQHHGYDPRRLEVEITETAILQDEPHVRQNIDRLRALGMKVALDDFGAGYSSLGHLRRYPFDKLKIDKEFIDDCSRDMQSATIVHAVVSIGRALGMKVIAEGGGDRDPAQVPQSGGRARHAGLAVRQGGRHRRADPHDRAPDAAAERLTAQLGDGSPPWR